MVEEAISGFVIFLGVMLGLKSPMIVDKIFAGALSALFLAVTVYLFAKSNIILGKNPKSKGVFCSCNRRLTY